MIGLTERDVTNSLQDALAGSIQTAPTFWLNPHNGVSYPIVVQTPQYTVELARRPAQHAAHRQQPARRSCSGRWRHVQPGTSDGGRLALQRAAGDRHLSPRCRAATSARVAADVQRAI